MFEIQYTTLCCKLILFEDWLNIEQSLNFSATKENYSKINRNTAPKWRQKNNIEKNNDGKLQSHLSFSSLKSFFKLLYSFIHNSPHNISSHSDEEAQLTNEITLQRLWIKYKTFLKNKKKNLNILRTKKQHAHISN